MRYLAILLAVICLLGATASQVNTYINGQTLTADQLNSEFSNIYSTLNSLDDANIIAGAAIDPSKVSTIIGGDGISRQSDGSLDVNVDGTTVKIISNVVQIVDLPGSALATGAVTTTQILDNTIIKADLAVKATAVTATIGNVALSNGTGAGLLTFLTGASGDLSNNLVNLTTGGSPVRISIVPATDGTESYIECEDLTTDPCTLDIARAGVTIFQTTFFSEGGIARIPPGGFSFLDAVAAGTYEYKVKYSVPSATALRILNVRLMAYEL